MNERPRGTAVLIAFRYPPMLGPGSQRAASFARHLPDAGWEPVVVTVRRGLYHRDERFRPPPVRTLRTFSPEPSRLLAPFRRPAGEARASGSEIVPDPELGSRLSRARRFVRDYVYLPDGQVLWIPFAARAASAALRASAGRRRVLFTTSVPYSAHLAGLIASRARRVPWVAEFRDPWSLIDDRSRLRSPLRKRIDAQMEGRVVRRASAIVVTTELTREAMVSAYPDVDPGRFVVVRNGFEPRSARPLSSPPAGPLLLVHAGSVPAEAPLEPLLEGLGRVAGEHPGGIRLIVLGPPERWSRAVMALGDPGWIEVRGIVAPDEARDAVAGASATLLLRPGEQHREFVAAKLLEYLGARRPILGVVSPTGEMAGLTHEYGDLRLVHEFSASRVAEAVGGLLDEHRRGDLAQPVVGRRPIEELTRQSQALRMAEVFEAVSGER